MPTLLIADDHSLFRAALRGASVDAVAELQVREADSLDSVLAALEQEPDILSGGARLHPRDLQNFGQVLTELLTEFAGRTG